MCTWITRFFINSQLLHRLCPPPWGTGLLWVGQTQLFLACTLCDNWLESAGESGTSKVL